MDSREAALIRKIGRLEVELAEAERELKSYRNEARQIKVYNLGDYSLGSGQGLAMWASALIKEEERLGSKQD